MRIGLELSGTQSHSRNRGIGRYVRNLAHALMARDPSSEFVLYAHPGEALDFIPEAPNGRLKLLAPDPFLGESTLLDALGREVLENPEKLDVLALLNPLEMCFTRQLPTRPVGGLPIVAVVYDVIPFAYRDLYLDKPLKAEGFYRRLQWLRNYDGLLAISEATRRDFLTFLNLPEDRVVNISSGMDGTFFVPDPTTPMPDSARAILDGLGIDRNFLMSIGTGEDHKNQKGLIAAFALLPPEHRDRLKLVVAGGIWEDHKLMLRDCAREHGVESALIMTNRIPDDWLRVLYQRCEAFVFPSLYEGFGLPVIEALHCGAVVVAGNNSSLVEAVGDAGLLADSADPVDLSTQILRLLEDRDLVARLRSRGPGHAAQFTWERTADTALQVLVRAASGARLSGRPRPRRRLALLVSRDHEAEAERLCAALHTEYSVDLYHEPGPRPHFAIGRGRFASRDRRQLPRYARHLHYAAVLDPWDQASLCEELTRTLDPMGIVVLRGADLGSGCQVTTIRDRLDGRIRRDGVDEPRGPHRSQTHRKSVSRGEQAT